LLWNVRSLGNNLKLHFVIQTLVDTNIHIACITESWLNSGHDHTIAILEAHGFAISHSFRPTRKGGGVAFLVRKGINFKRIIKKLEFDSFEWHGIHCIAKQTTHVICIYRKQEFPMLMFLEELNELMTAICGNSRDEKDRVFSGPQGPD